MTITLTKFACVLLTGLSLTVFPVFANATEKPQYKPSSRSPAAIDITTSEYGYSATAPAALTIGDQAPDFTLARAGGGFIKLADARATGPVVLIFYRGHW
ncbi:MAG: hypothetical protein AAF993_03325 [Pseudomonadota bacterium]